MVEKSDQKKCRDASIEIQETLAKWGKYVFYYYPKEHRIRPSEYAVRHMEIAENVTDLEHNILMDRIIEKEKLLKLFQDIDHGAKTVSAKIQSSEKTWYIRSLWARFRAIRRNSRNVYLVWWNGSGQTHVRMR